MIKDLNADDVETGKAHPFVEALVLELKAKLAADTTALVSKAGTGQDDKLIYSLGGRCAQLREVLQMIDSAKGTS